MKKKINVRMGEFEGEYFLDAFDDGKIIVQVPYLDKDEEDEEVVRHNVVECEKGDKAEIIKQFFYEESPIIIRAGLTYNLDEIIFDETDLPPFIEPDEIVN